MKHYTLTSKDEPKERIQRLRDSMPGAKLALYRYDAADPWPMRGFTRMANRVLRLSRVFDNEIICIYNDDISFEDFAAWERRATEAIAGGAGAVMPVQVDSRNPHSVIMGGVFAAYPGGIHRIGTREQHCRDEQERVRWLPFCAVAFNPRALQEVGLLDESMVMWFSDSDWCLRARLAGFDIILDRGVVIRHDNHATVGQIQPATPAAVRLTADKEAFRRKWGGEQLADYS